MVQKPLFCVKIQELMMLEIKQLFLLFYYHLITNVVTLQIFSERLTLCAT